PAAPGQSQGRPVSRRPSALRCARAGGGRRVIPVRLQLKNFMSYGEGVPPLDFTGVRLACLSGDNGNGKTALLDAMTWALFGETRAPSEDDVIRLGAPDVQVLFDFLVDGAKYRIHKARGRRGGAGWELQVWQED